MTAPSSTRPRIVLGIGLVLGALAVAALGLVVTWARLDRERPRALAASDRSPLERRTVDGVAYLVHPTLGFRVMDPGPGFVADGVGSPTDPQVWSYVNAARGGRFAISMNVARPLDEEAFRDQLASIRRAVAAAGGTVVDETDSYHPGRSVAELDTMVAGTAMHVRVDTFHAEAPAREYVVVVGAPFELRLFTESFVAPDGPVVGVGTGRAPPGTPTLPLPPVPSVVPSDEPSTFDSSIVVAHIRTQVGLIQQCYESRLATRPTLAGKVTVEFTIQSSGEVVGAHATDDTLGDAMVTACLVQIVDAMEFEPGPSDGAVVFSYPFVFAPQN